jgi:hypothetical protein
MIERNEANQNILSRLTYPIFHVRTETIWERFLELDSLYEQLSNEQIGSKRYDNIFHAYRWLKRQPNRIMPVVLGKEIPIWLDKPERLI